MPRLADRSLDLLCGRRRAGIRALLFDPPFSRIPASAAALSDRSVVSAETFTCIYGFTSPRHTEAYRFWKREQVADLKLLADAVIANGVNQIVWHGMPYSGADCQHEFYASVHVGPDCAFVDELPAFNAYLEHVCGRMQSGRTVSELAVYLPNEDMWMLDLMPLELRTPGAAYWWEMRHVLVLQETRPSNRCGSPQRCWLAEMCGTPRDWITIFRRVVPRRRMARSRRPG